MRDCYRPLLLFAPSASDPRYRRQIAILSASPSALQDRQILLIPFLADHGATQDSAVIAPLSAAEQAQLRQRFHIATAAFQVVLIGKDGGSKLSSAQPLSLQKLNGTVDGMPMRREELRQREERGGKGSPPPSVAK